MQMVVERAKNQLGIWKDRRGTGDDQVHYWSMKPPDSVDRFLEASNEPAHDVASPTGAE